MSQDLGHSPRRPESDYQEPTYVHASDVDRGHARHRQTATEEYEMDETRAPLVHNRDDSSATAYHERTQSRLTFQHDRQYSFAPSYQSTSSPTANGRFNQSTSRLSSYSETKSLTGHKRRSVHFGDRFFRRGKPRVGMLASLKAIALSSWLNVFVIFIPISWVAHFFNVKQQQNTGHFDFPYPVTFAFSLLAIMPLQKLFDFGGEQMSFYVGKDLGDLIVVTLNNAVEATLALILLIKCEIKLLQTTVIGVILLHLLLVPGTAFIVDGARLLHQDLHPHVTQLNHSLLVMGTLSLLLPAAFYGVLEHNSVSTVSGKAESPVNDETREIFLSMSHGLAVILLVVYVGSRFYLHNPPGEDEIEVPMALRDEEEELLHREPDVNQYVCIVMLIIALALMATTAIWLVESVEVVRGDTSIPEEWFGLILLPFASFSADGALAVGYFVRYVIQTLRGRDKPPAVLARAQAIDLSIQFILFWMPMLVLLGWWTNRPLPLLFDFFEIAVLLGSCFLVNYVTQDAKTNWAEGVAMVCFYAMIVLTAWYYRGQDDIALLLKYGTCIVSAHHGPAASGEAGGGGGGGEGGH